MLMPAFGKHLVPVPAGRLEINAMRRVITRRKRSPVICLLIKVPERSCYVAVDGRKKKTI
jgi:hypothetical protein